MQLSDVAGDFKTSEMLARIRNFRADPAESCPRAWPVGAKGNGEHRLTVEGPGEPPSSKSPIMPGRSDPDFFPLNVLDSLAAGPSGLNILGRRPFQ